MTKFQRIVEDAVAVLLFVGFAIFALLLAVGTVVEAVTGQSAYHFAALGFLVVSSSWVLAAVVAVVVKLIFEGWR